MLLLPPTFPMTQIESFSPRFRRSLTTRTRRDGRDGLLQSAVTDRRTTVMRRRPVCQSLSYVLSTQRQLSTKKPTQYPGQPQPVSALANTDR